MYAFHKAEYMTVHLALLALLKVQSLRMRAWAGPVWYGLSPLHHMCNHGLNFCSSLTNYVQF